MINIENFKIRVDGTALDVHVSTEPNEIIQSALIWTQDTFKDYDQAVDVSSKLEQTSNEEQFIVSAEEVGVTSLDGIYFIEFQTSSTQQDECINCSNNLGVAASLFKIKECLLEKVRSYYVCGGFFNSGCNENLLPIIIHLDVLISSLQTSLEFGYHQDAIEFFKVLNTLCDDCECKALPNPIFKSGLSYATLNGNIILQ